MKTLAVALLPTPLTTLLSFLTSSRALHVLSFSWFSSLITTARLPRRSILRTARRGRHGRGPVRTLRPNHHKNDICSSKFRVHVYNYNNQLLSNWNTMNFESYRASMSSAVDRRTFGSLAALRAGSVRFESCCKLFSSWCEFPRHNILPKGAR